MESAPGRHSHSMQARVSSWCRISIALGIALAVQPRHSKSSNFSNTRKPFASANALDSDSVLKRREM